MGHTHFISFNTSYRNTPLSSCLQVTFSSPPGSTDGHPTSYGLLIVAHIWPHGTLLMGPLFASHKLLNSYMDYYSYCSMIYSWQSSGAVLKRHRFLLFMLFKVQIKQTFKLRFFLATNCSYMGSVGLLIVAPYGNLMRGLRYYVT